jgi:FtsH-binding integral membrane protein
MASFASAFSSFVPQSSQAWNLQAMLKTSGISLDVQRHLVRVYATLSACVLSAALGCGGALLLAPTPLYTVEHSGYIALLTMVTTIGGIIWLHVEPVQNFNKRFAILMGVAASIGLSLASLIDLTLQIDPSILITALYVLSK